MRSYVNIPFNVITVNKRSGVKIKYKRFLWIEEKKTRSDWRVKAAQTCVCVNVCSSEPLRDDDEPSEGGSGPTL